MHKDYRGALIRAVYPDENRPEWVADDPLAKDAAQRIAELERSLEWLQNEQSNRLAQERERVANRIVGKYGTGIIGAREIAEFVRALEDK